MTREEVDTVPTGEVRRCPFDSGTTSDGAKQVRLLFPPPMGVAGATIINREPDQPSGKVRSIRTDPHNMEVVMNEMMDGLLMDEWANQSLPRRKERPVKDFSPGKEPDRGSGGDQGVLVPILRGGLCGDVHEGGEDVTGGETDPTLYGMRGTEVV